MNYMDMNYRDIPSTDYSTVEQQRQEMEERRRAAEVYRGDAEEYGTEAE